MYVLMFYTSKKTENYFLQKLKAMKLDSKDEGKPENDKVWLSPLQILLCRQQ